MPKTKKHYKLIKDKEWDHLKLLIKAGLTNRQITELTGRSWNVINGARRYPTHAAYMAHLNERKAKRAADKAQQDPLEAAMPQTTPSMTINSDEAIRQLMFPSELIASKMTDIVEALTELARVQSRHVDALSELVEKFMLATNQNFEFVAARLDKIEAQLRQPEPIKESEIL